MTGFVMQRTDFAFVAFIHDNALSDKSAEINRVYADIFQNIITPSFISQLIQNML